MSTTTEEYNGWANRETWACALWLMNDEGLYGMALEYAEAGIAEAVGHGCDPDKAAYYVGPALEGLWDELPDLLGHEETRNMRDDVGSVWRIDWGEIGRAFIEAVLEGDGSGRFCPVCWADLDGNDPHADGCARAAEG